MTFDEQHGWVERGTKGHRASAQVLDVDAEILALRRISARPAYDMEGARNRLAWVWLYGESASDARRGAYEPWRGGAGAQDSDRTGMATYRVDGDTLHVDLRAVIPARAQTIEVNVTIGESDAHH